MISEDGTKTASIVSDRLAQLRKNLGDRLGRPLTIQGLADRSGVKTNAIQRLEDGLKGNFEALLTILLYYRGQGYSLDWILVPDNRDIPMTMTPGEDLLKVNNAILDMSKMLNEKYQSISQHLRAIGLESINASVLPDEVVEPAGVL